MIPRPIAGFARAGRSALFAAAVLLTGLWAAVPDAQNFSYFTIGTGGTGGTYYPLGGVIANAISNPPGSLPCDRGGSCGVPGVIAVAQTSNGSVQNVRSVSYKLFNSAFSQSDVAYWAYTGMGMFEGRQPLDDLRAIAALYPEHVHLVATIESGIESVTDLAGMRVSIDSVDSGTYVDAILILKAFGLTEESIQATHMSPNAAANAMRKGNLDAFFVVSGFPTRAVSDVALELPTKLIPINGPEVEQMTAEYEFFAHLTIPADTYEGMTDPVETLAVGAQWITSADEDEELIYNITAALWNDSTSRLLHIGHPKGASVTIDTGLDGIAIPLHPGAERYYREVGLIN